MVDSTRMIQHRMIVDPNGINPSSDLSESVENLVWQTHQSRGENSIDVHHFQGSLKAREDGTRRVQEFLAKTEIDLFSDAATGKDIKAEFDYCLKIVAPNFFNPNLQNCRRLVFRRDKETKKRVRSFYNVFWSADLALGVVEYYIENIDGTFTAYLDESFDGLKHVKIDFASQENTRLYVDFDADGFPTINDTALVKHFADPFTYAYGKLSYSSELSKLVGSEYVYPKNHHIQSSPDQSLDLNYVRVKR